MLFWEFNWCPLWMLVLREWEPLVHVRCIRVCMCMCVRRWHSSQLERESGKGAISAQLALIASTLFWWAAALCEMTKCWVPSPPAPLPLLLVVLMDRTGGKTMNITSTVITPLLLSLCWSLPHLLLRLSCSVFAWSNIAVSVLLLMCLVFT